MSEQGKQNQDYKYSIPQLIEKSIQGDKEAFASLVQVYYKHMYLKTFEYLHNPQDTEDMVQEIVIRMHRFIRQIQDPQKFPDWLNQMIRSVSIDFLRKRKSESKTLSQYTSIQHMESDRTGLTQDIRPQLDRKTQREIILTAIAQLPEKLSHVMTLYYYDHLSAQEIADKLDLSLSAVEVRIYRAKKLLQKTLKGKIE